MTGGGASVPPQRFSKTDYVKEPKGEKNAGLC